MYHGIMDGRVMRFERNLHVVQPGIHQGLHESRVLQAPPVGVDAGDLAVVFRMGDQLGQVGAQGGLAAGKDDVRDANLPQPVENMLPLPGAQLGVLARAGIVAVRAVIVAAIGKRQVHAVRRGRPVGERRRGFQVQLANRRSAHPG